ncbi:30S ribosomal protein S17 [Candidatus Gottesmanbacteria bacterium]|nr:30S ribosomal protein S17 [Candidatus Gottesmanbacteria bacterium]MBI5465601.1 30S ribosomal protein S17 [Candidatus Gottesmanbacteria bacterium]
MKVLTGKVISVGKIPKTVTVEIESQRPHPLYKKLVKKNQKFLVHVEDLEIKLGDVVKIGQTRPISKRKHFKILEVLR